MKRNCHRVSPAVRGMHAGVRIGVAWGLASVGACQNDGPFIMPSCPETLTEVEWEHVGPGDVTAAQILAVVDTSVLEVDTTLGSGVWRVDAEPSSAPSISVRTELGGECSPGTVWLVPASVSIEAEDASWLLTGEVMFEAEGSDPSQIGAWWASPLLQVEAAPESVVTDLTTTCTDSSPALWASIHPRPLSLAAGHVQIEADSGECPGSTIQYGFDFTLTGASAAE